VEEEHWMEVGGGGGDRDDDDDDKTHSGRGRGNFGFFGFQQSNSTTTQAVYWKLVRLKAHWLNNLVEFQAV
jgi:hypothetical protein